jgi:hypothetical protein
MMKRNLGEYLRSLRTARRKELLLRCLTHNLVFGRGEESRLSHLVSCMDD